MRERTRSPRSSRAVSTRRTAARGGRASQPYDGFARERLSDIQRARIVRATFDIATEKGAAGVIVADVVERAGVSRRTFYELFADRDDCFLAAFEQSLEYASERVLPAYASGRSWVEKIRAGLFALLSFLDEQPKIGRVLIVESGSGAAAALRRRGEVIEALTAAIDRGRAHAETGAAVPLLTGESLVGGVLSVLHSRLAEDEHSPLVELTNPLVSMIVLPYMGPAMARKELERPLSPVVATPVEPIPADPFNDTGMRLTYRTVRALIAVAEHPGGSNRRIGDTAEVADQGQISKLMTRLQRAGLVINTGLGAGRGGPNSWSLTPSGQEVVSTIKAHTQTGIGV